MYVVVVQKFTFAISSPDEFLFVCSISTKTANTSNGVFCGLEIMTEGRRVR